MQCRQRLWHKVTLGLVVGVQQHHESICDSPMHYVSSGPSDIRVSMSALPSVPLLPSRWSGMPSASLAAFSFCRSVVQYLLHAKLPVLQQPWFAAALLSLWTSAPAVAQGPSHFQTRPEVVVIGEALGELHPPVTADPGRAVAHAAGPPHSGPFAGAAVDRRLLCSRGRQP